MLMCPKLLTLPFFFWWGGLGLALQAWDWSKWAVEHALPRDERIVHLRRQLWKELQQSSTGVDSSYPVGGWAVLCHLLLHRPQHCSNAHRRASGWVDRDGLGRHAGASMDAARRIASMRSSAAQLHHGAGWQLHGLPHETLQPYGLPFCRGQCAALHPWQPRERAALLSRQHPCLCLC